MRLYTKTGDQGQTSLYGGERRPKTDPRVVAYGDVDELQAGVGVALSMCEDAELQEILIHLQQDGFVLCSQLARPTEGDPSVRDTDISWLEHQIDQLDAALPPLRAFILQGGTPFAAHLHLARTICRRAERSVIALASAEELDSRCLIYLNRLSDLLFVLARTANARANYPETIWKRL